MANYRKSFNFRSGVQVDNDKFLVDGRGNVGVGTSAPSRPLDVYGKARVNDQLETEDFQVVGVSTFQGMVSVGSTIFADPNSGIVSAVSYRGDGSLLANVIAISTNGWVVANQGLSTSLNVFVGPFPEAPTLPTPLGRFQVGTGSSVFIIQDTGGWVGLGTTVPSTKLDVRGNVIVSGVSTFQDHVDVTGDLSVLSNFEVTGVSTFSNTVNFSEDIGIDGQTELDNVNVTGLSTFNSRADFKNNVEFYSSLKLRTTTDSDVFSISYSEPNDDVRFTFNQTGGTGGSEVQFLLRDNAAFKIRNSDTAGTIAKFTADGSNELYYDDVKRFETTGYGATVYNRLEVPNLDITGISTFSSTLNLDGVVNIPDGDGIKFGTVSDYAQLFSGSGEFYIRNTVGSGSGGGVQLQGRTGVHLWGGGTSATNLGLSVANGVPLLRYQGTQKASTEDYGFDVTGRLTTDELSVSGISTFNQLTSNNIAIGTTVFSSDFVLKKPTSVVADFVSTQGSVTLSLGADTSLANNSATVKYTPTSETLDISNRGSGDITFRTHVGSGALVGVETGGFLFRTGSTDDILAHIRSDGRFAVNQEVSEDQELDFIFTSNGNAQIKGNLNVQQNLNITGITTLQNLVVELPATFSEDQNFNTTTGISTFDTLNAGTRLVQSGIGSFIGVSTFFNKVCIGSSINPYINQNTAPNLDIYNNINSYQNWIGLSASPIYYDFEPDGQYGASGTAVEPLTDPRNADLVSQYDIDPNIYMPAFGYGDIQLKTGGIAIITQDYINIHPSIAQSTTGNWADLTPEENIGMGLEYVNKTNLCMLGINTTFTRSLVDLGYGVPSMNSYFIPPRLSTADIGTVEVLWDPTVSAGLQGHDRSYQATPYGLVTGGILFDIEKNQLKVATDSKTFSGIATFTNNGSGHESFVPPKVTDAERTVLTNAGIPAGSVVYNTDTDTLQQYDGSAWSSLVKQTGIGTQATISVVGSEIIFTVAGIGSTSLTLV